MHSIPSRGNCLSSCATWSCAHPHETRKAFSYPSTSTLHGAPWEDKPRKHQWRERLSSIARVSTLCPLRINPEESQQRHQFCWYPSHGSMKRWERHWQLQSKDLGEARPTAKVKQAKVRRA